MLRKKQSREEQVIIGLLVGGAIGSLLAFFLAPARGKDLRQDLKEDMDEYLGTLRDQSQKIFSETKDMTNNIIDRASKVFELSRKYAAGATEVPRDTIKNEISKIRDAFDSAVRAYKNYETVEEQAEAAVDDLYEQYADKDLPGSEGMGRRSK